MSANFTVIIEETVRVTRFRSALSVSRAYPGDGKSALSAREVVGSAKSLILEWGVSGGTGPRMGSTRPSGGQESMKNDRKNDIVFHMPFG